MAIAWNFWWREEKISICFWGRWRISTLGGILGEVGSKWRRWDPTSSPGSSRFSIWRPLGEDWYSPSRRHIENRKDPGTRLDGDPVRGWKTLGWSEEERKIAIETLKRKSGILCGEKWSMEELMLRRKDPLEKDWPIGDLSWRRWDPGRGNFTEDLRRRRWNLRWGRRASWTSHEGRVGSWMMKKLPGGQVGFWMVKRETHRGDTT